MSKKHSDYSISKEFFPIDHLTPPMSIPILNVSQKILRAPRFLWKDPELKVTETEIPTYDDDKITLYIISPADAEEKLPCLVFYHGGGFIYEGFNNHYRLAMMYAKYGRCKVIYVKYRLAPKYTYPTPQEDAFTAFEWVCNNADELGILPDKIAVTGDSAGGMLAVTTSLLAIKRNSSVHPFFQLIAYPWLDGRNNSDSCKRFTDTPMWNSKMTEKLIPIVNPEPDKVPLYLSSPVEADSFMGLPPAYIEVAEFDCLHDDGILYADLLKKEGIDVKLYESKGTMHGFDTKMSAPTSKKMIKKRIWYIRKMFKGDKE